MKVCVQCLNQKPSRKLFRIPPNPKASELSFCLSFFPFRPHGGLTENMRNRFYLVRSSTYSNLLMDYVRRFIVWNIVNRKKWLEVSRCHKYVIDEESEQQESRVTAEIYCRPTYWTIHHKIHLLWFCLAFHRHMHLLYTILLARYSSAGADYYF